MVITTHLNKRLYIDAQIGAVQEIQHFFSTFSAGVSAFFVLSGFLLSFPFWEAYLGNRTIPSFRLFAIRRAARIVPGYYVSLTVCFLLGFLLRPEAENPIGRFLAGVTFTSAFSWRTLFPAELNGPLWSVGFEVLCYFMLPFFMIGLFKSTFKRTLFNGLLYWAGVLAIILIINQFIQVFGQPDSYRNGWDYGLLGGAKTWWPHYNPIGFFAQYTFGVFAAALSVALSKRIHDGQSALCFDFIAVATTVGLTGLLWYMRSKNPFGMSFQAQPYYFPLFPAGIALLLVSLPFSRIMGKIFDNSFFRITAKLSFGLYIWHYIAFEIVRLQITPAFTFDGIKNIYFWFFFSTIAVLISYIIAAISWRFVEKPVLNWSHGKVEYIKIKYLKARTAEKTPVLSSILLKSGKQPVKN